MTSTSEQIRMTQDHVASLQASKAKAEDEEARVRNDIRIGEQRLAEAASQHRCVEGERGWRVLCRVFGCCVVAGVSLGVGEPRSASVCKCVGHGAIIGTP